MNFKEFLQPNLKESETLSLRLKLQFTKDLDYLEKKVRTLASNAHPTKPSDVELFFDGDKQHIRVNISGIPSAKLDAVRKEIKLLEQ